MRELDRALPLAALGDFVWQYSKEINEETRILPEIKEEIVEEIYVLAKSVYPNG